MSETIISIENLGKKYHIRHQAQRQRYVALRDVIAEKAKAIFSRSRASDLRPPTLVRHGLGGGGSDLRPPASSRASHEDFWALRHVSFDVRHGEVVGIIGRNGAGKSTLLKILSRITEPTEGRVHIKGRVASLLEVGTGFHPELTGRENIYLNGAILGMHRAEIRKKFDEIVAFAETETFLDTPVKRYSSGMYVRLAFAVAAHLEPEILIVDEVLAVGDAQFQKKCLGKMGEAAKGGRTVIFVSHNMGTVQALTENCVLLDRGIVVAIGDTRHVVEKYIASAKTTHIETDFSDATRYSPHLGTQIRICSIEPRLVSSMGFCLGEPIVFRIVVKSRIERNNLRFGGTITDINDSAIMSLSSSSTIDVSIGESSFDLTIRDCRLTPGMYSFALSIGEGDFTESRHNFDVVRPGPVFSVASISANGKPLVNWMSGYGPLLHPKTSVDVEKTA